ncbi:hypothetical protein ASD76_15375 [Altererythrobacter sp. Root672]|nr:hypothetical protein ASD76_15375 [Altererythrobacter sp. Root672]
MPYSFTMAARVIVAGDRLRCRIAEATRASPLKGKERAEALLWTAHEALPENLFSPSRLEIKRRQIRCTNCLGRLTA